MALLGMRVDNDSSGIVTPSIRSGYLLPFEIVSIHLLVVLVGAAYLARAKRRRTPRAVETAGQSESKEEVMVASCRAVETAGQSESKEEVRVAS